MSDNGYTQYGELEILKQFFGHSIFIPRLCVDIGAADGKTHSNTRNLIEDCGWSGVMVEPHPTLFSDLETLYKDQDTITLINSAVYTTAGKMPFYIYGDNGGEETQVSTLSEDFKEIVVGEHGDKYLKEPVMVDVVTLNDILSELSDVDFLDIDCEGVDMEVLKSNDWNKNRPTLICIEMSMEEEELTNYMSSVDYLHYATTLSGGVGCNAFFARKPQ